MKNLLLLLVLTLPALSFGQWRIVDSIDSGNLYAIHFINADTGFTYHEWATMRKTTDGGMTWDTVNMAYGGFIYDINFASADVGYAVGGAWFPAGQHYANAILKTTDGGETWDSVLGNYNHGVFNHVEVLSEMEFYASGDYGLMHSSDGGVTLDSILPSSLQYEKYLKTLFPAPNTGYILGHSSLGGGDYLYNVYKSTNGGTSWQSVYADTFHSPTRDFVMTASGYGLLTNGKGQVMQTMNGGNSWQVIQHSEPEVVLNTLHLTGSYVYASGHNVADTSNGIYRTGDWGANWSTQISSDANDFWIQDMSFPEPSIGYFTTYQQLYKNDKLLSVEKPEPTKFQLYPNPSLGSVFIQLEEPANASIQVINNLGQVAGNHSLNGAASISLDLNHLVAGLYFIVIQEADQRQVQRLILLDE